jgi:hypothetical protein
MKNLSHDFKAIRAKIKEKILSGKFNIKRTTASVVEVNCDGVMMSFHVIGTYFNVFLYGDIDLKLTHEEDEKLIKLIKQKQKK